MAMNIVGNSMFNLMFIQTLESTRNVFLMESCGFI